MILALVAPAASTSAAAWQRLFFDGSSGGEFRYEVDRSHRRKLIVKSYSKDGTTSDDAVRTDLEIMREQAKIKGAVTRGQVLDYELLKEVLAEMKK
jgi:hypothetical protein